MTLCKTVITWPLRKQIMISFLFCSLILNLAIFFSLFVIIKFIEDGTKSLIETTVNQRVELNMHYISLERGNLLIIIQDVVGSLPFIINNMINETYIPGIYGPELLAQGKNYPDFSAIPASEKTNPAGKYGKNSVCLQKSTIQVKNTTELSIREKEFLNKSAIIDRYLPLLVQNTYLSEAVFRVNIIYINETSGTKIMRNYPGMELTNKEYKPDGYNSELEYYWLYCKSIFAKKQEFPFPYTILNGPYKDMKDNFESEKIVVTFNSMLSFNDSLAGVIQVEMELGYIQKFIEKLKFMNTGIATFMNIFGKISIIPDTWTEMNKLNPYINISDNKNRTGFSVEDMNYYKDPTQFNSKLVNNSLESVFILDQDNKTTEYIRSIVFLPHNFTFTSWTKQWIFSLILYVQKEELTDLKTSLHETITKFNEGILFSAQISILFTFMLVIIFCYRVAMSISKPLKSMINAASVINNNATERSMTDGINMDEVLVGEYQISELTRVFKKLLGKVEGKRGVSQNTKRTRQHEYPLNQFNKEYTDKAKLSGSEINWYDIIEEIENPEMEEELILD